MCRGVSLLMPMMIVLMMKNQMPGMVGMGTNPSDIVYRWSECPREREVKYTKL